MFQRYVSIDWSGAGTDEGRVDLRVVEASPPHQPRVVPPPGARGGIRSWSRAEAARYLSSLLERSAPRALIAMDFGFGLPWGADRAIFGCDGWRAMLDAVSRLYRHHGTARATAEAINANPRFHGHGPYRFNESRTDYRFYLDSGVAYYRQVEVAIPQAISQWYLGSGGTVGFHTISGLAALAGLLSRRDTGELLFTVWPQEALDPPPDHHLVVESYPAICPRLVDYGPCGDDHQRDAWRVLDWILRAADSQTLGRSFVVQPKPFGRIEGVSFQEQVRFEGWIIGVE
jgi:hypothetical protein